MRDKWRDVDLTERNAHNGITQTLHSVLRHVDQLKLAVEYVGVGEHNKSIYAPNKDYIS